ncbi:glycosyltransferase [Pectinatus brassicae]|uniref:Methyl coenzyme M reductase subunit D n=1 Tax=Pectinatus brassicae TaxID=862415 RepID=A0A840UXR6_9FIRM|nr:glycosyltransferase [Pectinatus brassicae]MBB5337653.1 methyl coenzyme M reductase subunit D [Pectinatus brassicae]
MVNMNLNRFKIAFIIKVSDNNECINTLNSLAELIIPTGYEVEVIKIENKNNIVKSYNQAMKSSIAKYKIYIREGIKIINKNFLEDVINIFKKNWNIGIIGMSGVKIIPTNGNIFSAIEQVGKIIIEGNMT